MSRAEFFSGPMRQSPGRPSWVLLVILEAVELALALVVPRLASLAILAFLMPFTACQLLSDSALARRLIARRSGSHGGSPGYPALARPARAGRPRAGRGRLGLPRPSA